MKQNMFLRNKSVKILIHLNDKGYSPKSNFKIGCTYSYMSTCLRSFKDFGLITKEKKGRTNEITLTKKGKQIAENLKNIQLCIKDERRENERIKNIN